ncbi:hypothetical protein SCALM49S_10139 [Streptomyces californicus]
MRAYATGAERDGLAALLAAVIAAGGGRRRRGHRPVQATVRGPVRSTGGPANALTRTYGAEVSQNATSPVRVALPVVTRTNQGRAIGEIRVPVTDAAMAARTPASGRNDRSAGITPAPAGPPALHGASASVAGVFGSGSDVGDDADPLGARRGGRRVLRGVAPVAAEDVRQFPVELGRLLGREPQHPVAQVEPVPPGAGHRLESVERLLGAQRLMEATDCW